jgi:hypothetical protein
MAKRHTYFYRTFEANQNVRRALQLLVFTFGATRVPRTSTWRWFPIKVTGFNAGKTCDASC